MQNISPELPNFSLKIITCLHLQDEDFEGFRIIQCDHGTKLGCIKKFIFPKTLSTLYSEAFDIKVTICVKYFDQHFQQIEIEAGCYGGDVGPSFSQTLLSLSQNNSKTIF